MIAAPSRLPPATGYFSFETPPATGYSFVRKPAGRSLLGVNGGNSVAIKLYRTSYCRYNILSDHTPSAGMACS